MQLPLLAFGQPSMTATVREAIDVDKEAARHPFGVDGHAIAQFDPTEAGKSSGIEAAPQFESKRRQHLHSHGDYLTLY